MSCFRFTGLEVPRYDGGGRDVFEVDVGDLVVVVLVHGKGLVGDSRPVERGRTTPSI